MIQTQTLRRRFKSSLEPCWTSTVPPVEHPEILSCQTIKQWLGVRPHRAYTWLEGFESLSAVDGGTATLTCMEVWEPIYRLAQDGSVLRSVWLATADELSMRGSSWL